ncbi:MAG TPA: DEAD/DEAH box helicase [Candidatus Saccharimonadia bacterium]|nr:DEAD/DEAH box helicase [Candidatus Saccharimonadia bacterium]
MPYSYRSRASGSAYKQKSYHSRPSSGRRFKKDYIDPSRFVKSAKSSSVVEAPIKHAFADFGLHPLIQKNLDDKSYVTPTPIQDQTIPIGIVGKDVVGIADTGTGKTAAFAIPIIQKLISDKTSMALIMAPTRELADQIEDQVRSIAKNSGLMGALLIGGVAMGPQLKDLRARPNIVIGTPGRIKDHFEQGTLKLENCNVVVLDEVDRMLDMGFINDIQFILEKTSPKRQSFFFSATLDEKVKTIINKFSYEPEYILMKTGDTSDNVDQNVITYRAHGEKIDKLHDLLIKQDVEKTLIFDDTHRSVEKLCKELQLRGFNTDAIHGGKSQSQRQRALKKFKDNNISILVATDVAARGIDVIDITHIVNYSVPQSYSDYVHRIGRTGRAGRRGYALTFVEKH